MLIPLFGEVVLDKRYSLLIRGLKGAKAADIGTGTPETWHGTPDIRVKGCNMVATEQFLVEDQDCESEDELDEVEEGGLGVERPTEPASPATKPAFPGSSVERVVNFEGKLEMKQSNLPQLLQPQ